MGESDETIDDEVDLGPLHALMAIPEAERAQWCIDVVNALTNALEDIMSMTNKIKQAREMKAFLADFRAKRDEIVPVFFYMVKPPFRDTIQNFIEKFAGEKEEEEKE